MPDYDAGFKIVARHSGPALPRLGGVVVDRWEPIGDAVQTTERLADRAFRARRGGRRFIVYMEAYTRWADSAVWSVLAKSGLLAERERLPTLSLIFVLLPRGYQPQHGTFRLEAEEGRPTQQVWFHEVRLWEQEPEPWWDEVPGLMPLYPLCRYTEPVSQAVAHAAAAIRAHEPDTYKRADLLTILAVFGRLKDRSADMLSIIGREHMRESPFYQEVLEEGGQLQARKDILEVLEARFGANAAKEFTAFLDRIADLEKLKGLLRVAAKGRRVSQFRRALAELEG